MILTTIPAKTIMSNTFEFLFMLFLWFRAQRQILNNTRMGVCQEIA
jgi:hypothetical protein